MSKLFRSLSHNTIEFKDHLGRPTVSNPRDKSTLKRSIFQILSSGTFINSCIPNNVSETRDKVWILYQKITKTLQLEFSSMCVLFLFLKKIMKQYQQNHRHNNRKALSSSFMLLNIYHTSPCCYYYCCCYFATVVGMYQKREKSKLQQLLLKILKKSSNSMRNMLLL